jgi:hypothetical protein
VSLPCIFCYRLVSTDVPILHLVLLLAYTCLDENPTSQPRYPPTRFLGRLKTTQQVPCPRSTTANLQSRIGMYSALRGHGDLPAPSHQPSRLLSMCGHGSPTGWRDKSSARMQLSVYGRWAFGTLVYPRMLTAGLCSWLSLADRNFPFCA